VTAVASKPARSSLGTAATFAARWRAVADQKFQSQAWRLRADNPVSKEMWAELE